MESEKLDRFIREPECAAITGLNRITRYQMERRGQFPARRKITSHTVGWLFSEIKEWMQTRPVKK